MNEAEFEQIVTQGHELDWELFAGRLREKPARTWEEGEVVTVLSSLLYRQLDRQEFRVRVGGRVRLLGTIFRPDVSVVPSAYGDEFRARPGVLAIFSNSLPLIVEVWSRSTGDYDVDAKVPIFQRRGDLEIWRIHPYERTVTVWRRLEDGSYDESVHREGIIRPAALPGVAIDIAQLFAE